MRCGFKLNTVCLIDTEGKEIEHQPFSNTLSGAQVLESWLLKIMKEYDFPTLKIATELTSVLDLQLVDFLASSQVLAAFKPSIYQFNSKFVRNFKRVYPDKEKTDKLDAFVIADRLRFGRFSQPYETHQPYLPFRRLTRYRFHIVQAISREKAYFLTHLYLKFLGFSIEKPFGSLFGATSMEVITESSPGELVHFPLQDLVQFLIENTKNRFKEPEKVAETLKGTARESSKLTPALASSIDLVLATILQTLRALEVAPKEVDRPIEKEFQALHNTLHSVKSIGPVYSAGIFSEIEEITRFLKDDALAKFAGLTWRRYQSGNFEAEKTRMSKTRNEYLRYYLIEVANALRVHNGEYRAYYETKFKEVTKHQHKRTLALTARNW